MPLAFEACVRNGGRVRTNADEVKTKKKK